MWRLTSILLPINAKADQMRVPPIVRNHGDTSHSRDNNNNSSLESNSSPGTKYWTNIRSSYFMQTILFDSATKVSHCVIIHFILPWGHSIKGLQYFNPENSKSVLLGEKIWTHPNKLVCLQSESQFAHTLPARFSRVFGVSSSGVHKLI